MYKNIEKVEHNKYIYNMRRHTQIGNIVLRTPHKVGCYRMDLSAVHPGINGSFVNPINCCPCLVTRYLVGCIVTHVSG